MSINLAAIQGPPVAFHKLTRAQLLTLAIALQDQRDNALAYARDLEARIGRVDEVVRSMDQRVKQNVRNIERGLYDETFTAVAHGVNSFAESSAIRIRAALTATEGQA